MSLSKSVLFVTIIALAGCVDCEELNEQCVRINDSILDQVEEANPLGCPPSDDASDGCLSDEYYSNDDKQTGQPQPCGQLADPSTGHPYYLTTCNLLRQCIADKKDDGC